MLCKLLAQRCGIRARLSFWNHLEPLRFTRSVVVTRLHSTFMHISCWLWQFSASASGEHFSIAERLYLARRYKPLTFLTSSQDTMPFYYDEAGSVADWGPSNIQYCGDHGYVVAWEMWQVKIWWKRSSHPWNEQFIFHVEHFDSILRHWNTYFPCIQGCTDRIVFVVECWVWSFEGGWEYKDYM